MLSKHKPDTKNQFIDASGLFKKETNNNVLTDEHMERVVERVVEVFDSKEDGPHFAASVDQVGGKDLSVSTYIEAKDTREVVDIAELNAELSNTVAKINSLRADIDAIVAEIEGEEVAA